MILGTEKGFSGIDMRVKLQNGIGVANYMRNFRVTDSGSLVKRNAIKEILRFGFFDGQESHGLPVRGLWTGMIKGKELLVVSIDGRLYTLDIAQIDITQHPTVIGEIESEDCIMFEFNGYLYIKTSNYYGKYDGETLTEVEGYTPCVAIGVSPSGAGEVFEQINLISDKRRVLFSSDGNALEYVLPETEIDSIVSVKLDGVEFTEEYSLNERKAIHFSSPPPEGINNLEVTYSKKNSDLDKKRIFGCTKIMLFGGNSDGRAFLWGNPELPNYRFYSELADGIPSVEYFPVNAFTVIGNGKITCIVQQYDRQLIFTKDQAYYSYCDLQKDALGNTYSSFPVFNLNGSKGCLFETEGCIVNNRPVTLCDDGLNMWESTNVQNEKNAVCFSNEINDSLSDIQDGKFENLAIFDFQANRELFFIHNSTAYIYNYGNGFWYIYDGFEGKRFSVFGKKLFLIKENGIFVFSNDIETDEEIEAVWESARVSSPKKSGRCDVVAFESDLHKEGPIELQIDVKKGAGEDGAQRSFSFGNGSDGFMRIACRPTLKRATPFSLRITASGKGKLTLHGIAIKTREKERSLRNGLR